MNLLAGTPGTPTIRASRRHRNVKASPGCAVVAIVLTAQLIQKIVYCQDRYTLEHRKEEQISIPGNDHVRLCSKSACQHNIIVRIGRNSLGKKINTDKGNKRLIFVNQLLRRCSDVVQTSNKFRPLEYFRDFVQ